MRGVTIVIGVTARERAEKFLYYSWQRDAAQGVDMARDVIRLDNALAKAIETLVKAEIFADRFTAGELTDGIKDEIWRTLAAIREARS